MMRTTLILFIIAITTGLPGKSQSENPDIRRGNDDYKEENYSEAELNYRQALEENPNNTKALYNLSNALYKLGRYDEAANILEGLTSSDISDDTRADVYHNLGNAHVHSQKLAEAVEAYKNSLRIRPWDDETRQNLALAQQMLEEQQQQEQQQQQQNDQDDQQQEQQEQQPNENNDQRQKEDEEQESKPQPDQISPQDAERILDALNQQEQDIQERIEREEKQRQPARPQKQW
ncbi:MAG: tetratricopeptide repeat protein [Bacteroidota bacterium]